MEKYDVIIIGGGMAGLTAGIYATRANMSVLLLEKSVCGGLANLTHIVENYPSYPSINGMELMEKVKEHAVALGVKIEEVNAVLDVELGMQDKIIHTDDGDFIGKAVIVATGRVPISLPLETEWERIHYCSVCDGIAYKGKDLIVIGGGNSGFDETLYLIGLGINSVTIVEAMDTCMANKSIQQSVAETGKVQVLTSTKVVGINPSDSSCIVQLEDMHSGKKWDHSTQGMFVFIGQKPNTEIFKEKLERDKNGYLITDADMCTKIPGVFGAGDVTAKTYRQLTTAMSDGTIAALSAERYIRLEYQKK